MASTLTASTMTVTISESITLNGANQGGTTSLSVGSIAEVYKRIMTVPVSGSGTITLLTTTGDAGSTVESGKFIVGDMKYLRITNLNDTAGEGVKLHSLLTIKEIAENLFEQKLITKDVLNQVKERIQ